MPAALLSMLLVAGLGGCAWRSASAEHYLGPVLFRYSEPRPDRAAIHQVVAIGALAEGGSQWGLTLGVVHRTSVVPRIVGVEEPVTAPTPVARWTPVDVPPEPGRWNVSWFYLRLPAPRSMGLITRRLYGAQVIAGPELSAVSLGITAVTRVRVPDDALVHVIYDSHAPLSAVFSVWPVGPDGPLPFPDVLEEVMP